MTSVCVCPYMYGCMFVYVSFCEGFHSCAFTACKYELLFLTDHRVTWSKHACFSERSLKILSCCCAADFFFLFMLNHLCFGSKASHLISQSFLSLIATTRCSEKIYSPPVTDCDILDSYNTATLLHFHNVDVFDVTSSFPRASYEKNRETLVISWYACQLMLNIGN